MVKSLLDINKANTFGAIISNIHEVASVYQSPLPPLGTSETIDVRLSGCNDKLNHDPTRQTSGIIAQMDSLTGTDNIMSYIITLHSKTMTADGSNQQRSKGKKETIMNENVHKWAEKKNKNHVYTILPFNILLV